MAAELVETSRLFARTVAAIDPAWAEALAGDLVKRSYGEPRWEKKQGSAVADEKVTLYGVPIVPKRRVQLARIDPEQARELFIRHALVDGDWPYAIDRNPLYALRPREPRAARRARPRSRSAPGAATSWSTTRRWSSSTTGALPRDRHRRAGVRALVRRTRGTQPDLLTMTRAALLDEDDEPRPTRRATRPSGSQGDQRFRLAYRFEPGAEDDGVTVEMPLALLAARRRRSEFSWLVPGLREELVTALLKSLPKAIRKNVVPGGRLGAQAAARAG